MNSRTLSTVTPAPQKDGDFFKSLFSWLLSPLPSLTPDCSQICSVLQLCSALTADVHSRWQDQFYLTHWELLPHHSQHVNVSTLNAKHEVKKKCGSLTVNYLYWATPFLRTHFRGKLLSWPGFHLLSFLLSPSYLFLYLGLRGRGALKLRVHMPLPESVSQGWWHICKPSMSISSSRSLSASLGYTRPDCLKTIATQQNSLNSGAGQDGVHL